MKPQWKRMEKLNNLFFAYMLTLCAIRGSRARLDDCGYLGDGGFVRPLMRELTASELLACEPVQRAARKEGEDRRRAEVRGPRRVRRREKRAEETHLHARSTS